jgi:hypothetical protein
MLRCTPRNFPFGAGVVLINSDGVGNLKVAVDCAIESGCITGTHKLLRWGFADRTNEGHGRPSSLKRSTEKAYRQNVMAVTSSNFRS